MDIYEYLLENCKRCHNCNSCKKLEVHHRVFRSELEQWVLKNIAENAWVYKETRWLLLEEWWLNDIQNLVVLCAKCHNKRIHGGDTELREYYRYSFTEPKTLFNIPFQKPITNLF